MYWQGASLGLEQVRRWVRVRGEAVDGPAIAGWGRERGLSRVEGSEGETLEEGRAPSGARPRECGSALWWPAWGPAPIGTLKSAKMDKT